MSFELHDRYSRQVLFAGIGPDGQKMLSKSRVSIVGCGATGSAIASLLARSGVGMPRILDRDYVESSNLQRQTLFDETDARESLPKAIAAPRQIARFNSQILVEAQSKMRRTLLSCDVWSNERAEIAAAKPRLGCQACGDRDFIHLAGERRPHITLCGRNSVQIHEQQRPIDFAEMTTRLLPHG